MASRSTTAAPSDAPNRSPVLLDVESLRFDHGNPRFYGQDGSSDQLDLLATLWRDFSVSEIAMSIAANGYFPYEPMFAAEEDGEYVVIEGNRRLAAVKLLRDPGLRSRVGATELPRLTARQIADLKTLPVIVTPRDAIWQFVGFKHVNGPQPWQSFSKAQYIAWVHNEVGESLEEIARHIGDEHTTVKRLYRGLMVLQQAESAGFNREDRFKSHFSFSHLYTGLDYPGVRKFIGLTESRDYQPKPVPPSRLKPLGELCVWLYGSKTRVIKPLVQSQNPDLRRLDEVLQSADGTAALRQGLPLNVSLDISRGDQRLFREAVVGAKSALQDARGTVLSGYAGEPDLLQHVEDIAELAESLVDEMRNMRRRNRKAGKSTARQR
jgi:hypothetical protein